MSIKITHRLTGAVLFEAVDAKTIREAVIAAIKAGADLSSADLSSADLRFANLRSADLSSADLSSADLSSADLSSANLRSANLRSADHVKSALIESFKGSASRTDGYQFLIFTSSDLGNIIRAGCRTFTLEEFHQHVADSYPGSPKAEETIRILNYLEGCLTQQAW